MSKRLDFGEPHPPIPDALITLAKHGTKQAGILGGLQALVIVVVSMHESGQPLSDFEWTDWLKHARQLIDEANELYK